MNLSPVRAIIFQRKHLLVLVCAFMIALAALVLIAPFSVWADAGPAPTPTWTNTPVPPSPTVTVTFPLPTPTITITATLTLVPTTGLPVPTDAGAGQVAETPVPTAGEQAGGGGALACMPLAIIFILGVVIAATWLLTRRSQEEVVT
jgi:hypothetical protein